MREFCWEMHRNHLLDLSRSWWLLQNLPANCTRFFGAAHIALFNFSFPSIVLVCNLEHRTHDVPICELTRNVSSISCGEILLIDCSTLHATNWYKNQASSRRVASSRSHVLCSGPACCDLLLHAFDCTLLPGVQALNSNWVVKCRLWRYLKVLLTCIESVLFCWGFTEVCVSTNRARKVRQRVFRLSCKSVLKLYICIAVITCTVYCIHTHLTSNALPQHVWTWLNCNAVLSVLHDAGHELSCSGSEFQLQHWTTNSRTRWHASPHNLRCLSVQLVSSSTSWRARARYLVRLQNSCLSLFPQNPRHGLLVRQPSLPITLIHANKILHNKTTTIRNGIRDGHLLETAQNIMVREWHSSLQLMLMLLEYLIFWPLLTGTNGQIRVNGLSLPLCGL